MKKQGPVKLKPVRKTYLWGTEDWMLSWLNEGLKEIPLLIKIIRARDALSVQVHPQDALAWELEQGTGKTEMWYVLDCEPGACLYYGLKHQISVKHIAAQHNAEIFLESEPGKGTKVKLIF